MKIWLEGTGKRYQRHWVFKELTYTFGTPGSYALLGANGSGKSTLLRIIAGMQAASTGTVAYQPEEKKVPLNEAFSFLSFCAPGMDLPEELTLREVLDFHFSFKRPMNGLTVAGIIGLTGLQKAANKPIGDYSSGMRQRVKLAQAIFSDTPVLLLDEPCTNLDEAGVQQYLTWIADYTADRLVIVASNDEREYSFCKEQIRLTDYQ